MNHSNETNVDMLMDVYRELSDKMTKHRVVAFLKHLRKNDLTLNQYSILGFIDQEGPCLPIRLAEYLELKAATITYLVDSLEQRGLVRKTPNPRDGRSHYVQYTDEGRELVRSARSEGDAEIIESFKQLDQDEADMIYVLMKMLRRKLFN
ncbi:MarR family winged helix-turn-helix transcriptional regulator [Paenibacillus sp. GCM10028914]|uniref:MarR family winged helix-turn-helix transcriptional regulator n=1 Tax=Paenibacillus sp. GCM10028914 TaxID=3273416 RepID=UPI003605C3C3